MKQFKLYHKIFALVIALFFVFNSMSQINSHSYTTGFSNVHQYCPDGITCCFGIPTHMSYGCGKAFHLD